MKLLISMLFGLSAFLAADDHDVPMAIFTVSTATEGLALEVAFDAADYAAANSLAQDKPDPCELEDYLNRTTSWTIEGQEQALRVQSIGTKEGHLLARCRLGNKVTRVEEIVIENQFLLSIPNQTNVVMLELDDRSRGFRMHEGRQKVSASY